MCLAIPSKITKIKNNMATIDVDGVQREASLLLLEDARIGDFVIVHAGFAIQKIDEAAAMETLKFLKEAAAFVGLLREVKDRDDLVIFAWTLMSNHFHIALRTGAIPLAHSMRSLQRRVTRGYNVRRGIFGPLWQGRYKAKLVGDQRYLDGLLAYIHLNPVSAGLVRKNLRQITMLTTDSTEKSSSWYSHARVGDR